ncbi:hypothetical protein BJX64DRAFT_279867 [Aspergillus heterothallicus]
MSSPGITDNALTSALREFAQAAGLSAGVTPASPAEVIRLIEEANQKFQSSSSTAKFSQKLSPCLQSIARFSSVLDSQTQFDPSPSSLVWGSLKFLLQVHPLQYANYLERLGEMFEEFGQFLPFMVQGVVVHLYTDIVQFFTRAVKFLKKKPRDLIFRTLVKPFEHDYAQILKSYQGHKNELQFVALAAMERNARLERQLAETARDAEYEDRKRAQEEREHAQRERRAAERKKSATERVAAQKSRVGALQEIETQTIHRKVVENQLQGNSCLFSKWLQSDSIIRWLNPPDYENTLHQALRQREKDTVQWINTHPKYLSWSQSTGWKRETLWIFGAPGTGKTILAATIIECLQAAHALHNEQEEVQPYAVCFFFFDSNNIFEQPEAAMLRSLVAQLLHQEKEFEPLDQIYAERSSLPNSAEILQLLLALWVQVSPTMKLLVVSRPEPDIKRFFSPHPQFELTEALTKLDVRKALKARVEAAWEGKKIRATDPKLRQEIVEALVSNSSGIPWATMQVKHLQTLRVQTDRTLRTAVRNLPKGVVDIYGQTLSKINSYAEEDRLLAEELLKWVVAARRPLNVSELCYALAIEVGEEELDEDNIPGIQTKFEGGTVWLVHSTAAKYLLQPSNKASVPEDTRRYFIDEAQAHTLMAKKCISYLSLLAFRDRISKSQTLTRITLEEVTSFPLLEYAALNWWRHVVNSSISEDSAKNVIDLMLNLAKPTQGLSWLETSITLPNSVEHLQMVSRQVGAWLRRIKFAHQGIADLQLWLKELLDLARLWESVLRESPFELRSTVRKFGTEGSFFHKNFGSDLTGKIELPPVTLPGFNDPLEQGNAFDILVDDEEGYVLHPSGNIRFHFSWQISQENGSTFIVYTIYSQNPTTRRQFKEISFGHSVAEIQQDFLLGFHTVTFSPDWDYMAIATVESIRGQHPHRSTLRYFMWQIGNLENPSNEILQDVRWTSSISGVGGKMYKGYVGQSDYDPFRGSRCAITFRKLGSKLVCLVPSRTFDVRYGTAYPIDQPPYLERIVSQPYLSQCTFSPDGRRIAMVRNSSEFEIANIDGSKICKKQFQGYLCEIISMSRTGRFVALWLSQPMGNESRLVTLDTMTNTANTLLTGITEQRFDEVSGILQWNTQGCYNKRLRHCIQVYSVFNWIVGGKSSELYIEPDIDHPLDPIDQRWYLSQPVTAAKEMSLSSSATYLFSDRTIRLEDGSFVLSLGFSHGDEYCCVLTSKQKPLLPSSAQSMPPAPKPTVPTPPAAARFRTYARFFHNNKKLGCLQLGYYGTEGRWMDYLDYRTHDIAEELIARVYIWDVSDSQKLIRSQVIQLTQVHRTMLLHEQYRRLDVAFHPASDRMAIFNTVYHLGTAVEYKIFDLATVHPDIVANRTNNAWQILFSADGKYIVFAVTASTRAPGLFGRRGEVMNSVVLFETDQPNTPLCSNISSKGGDTLAMGSCSVVFHPTEKKLLWTSLFVFTDGISKPITKLLTFDKEPCESYHVTDIKYDEFKFRPGKQVYGHPAQNAKPGYWDQLGAGTLHPTSFMEKGVIYFIGLDRDTRHVVGIIPKEEGPDGTVFVKRTILQLPPTGRLPHSKVRVLRRESLGVTIDYVVTLIFDDGRLWDHEQSVVKPVFIVVGASEVLNRPDSTLTDSKLDDIQPILEKVEQIKLGTTTGAPRLRGQSAAALSANATPKTTAWTFDTPSVSVPEELVLCAICGKPGRRCTRCKEVVYCGIEHQKQDWKKHKESCRAR